MLEYIWAAAWSFHAKDDPAAEDWVAEKALAVLRGRAGQVAGSLAAQAGEHMLADSQRTGVDACVRYLVNKQEYQRILQAWNARQQENTRRAAAGLPPKTRRRRRKTLTALAAGTGPP